MKKLFVFLFVFAALFCNAQYTIRKMSDYPAKTGTLPGISYCLMNDSGVTKRVTALQICTTCGTSAGYMFRSDTNTILYSRHDIDSLIGTPITGVGINDSITKYAWKITGNSATDSTANFLGTTDVRPVIFKTNNTERARISSNGYVGIGTATPTTALDLRGTYYNEITTAMGIVVRAQYSSQTFQDALGEAYLDGTLYNANTSDRQYVRGAFDAVNPSIIWQTINTDLGTVLGTMSYGYDDNTLSLEDGSILLSGTCNFLYQNGTEAIGKVLTSDTTGNSTWSSAFGGIAVKDSLTDLVTGSVFLTKNKVHVITGSGTITATTLNFQAGLDGDWIEIIFERAVTTLTGGTNTGTITFPVAGAGISRLFKNIGGNWY